MEGELWALWTPYFTTYWVNCIRINIYCSIFHKQKVSQKVLQQSSLRIKHSCFWSWHYEMYCTLNKLVGIMKNVKLKGRGTWAFSVKLYVSFVCLLFSKCFYWDWTFNGTRGWSTHMLCTRTFECSQYTRYQSRRNSASGQQFIAMIVKSQN